MRGTLWVGLGALACGGLARAAEEAEQAAGAGAGVWMFWVLGLVGALAALGFAYKFFKWVARRSEGDEVMRQIAGHVREGAYAYLRRQYKVVAMFFAAAFVFFFFLAFVLGVQSKWVPFAFLTGGFFSGLAGFLGMLTATHASARTAEAAKHSLNGALRIAFRSGAVMGLVVVGLGLLDISIWFFVLRYVAKLESLVEMG